VKEPLSEEKTHLVALKDIKNFTLTIALLSLLRREVSVFIVASMLFDMIDNKGIEVCSKGDIYIQVLMQK
jgi:hypothetical protein